MEYYSKCNVCGKITCYTDKDLKNNKTNSIIAGLAALSSISSAVVGTRYDMYESNKLSTRATDKIVDYSKCSNCRSEDVTLVTKKFAIFSNKVKGNYSISDLKKEATNYLEKGDYENAFCFSNMILKEDEKNYDACLIKFLSSYEVKSLEEINKLNIDYSDNQHFKNLISVANKSQKNKLLLNSQKTKYNCILINSTNLLKRENNENIIKDIDYYIEKLKDYDTEKSNELLENLDFKKKEILYILGCDYLNKNDMEFIKKALGIFEKLNDYKDSKNKLKTCMEQLKNNKKEQNKSIIIAVACISFIFIIFVISSIISNDQAYKKANALIEEKNYSEAVKVYEKLNNYKDSKQRKQEAENEIIYLKAEDYLDKGQFLSASSEYQKIKGYKDSNNKEYLSQLYYNIEGYTKESAQSFFDLNMENFKLINDESEIKKIIINKWLVGMIGYKSNLNTEIFKADGTGYRPNTSVFKDLLWKTDTGYLYYTIWSEIIDADKYEFREVLDGVYLLVSPKKQKAEYIFILYDSEVTKKLDLKDKEEQK